VKGLGVKRLVVINSGGYRFADIALDGPIHLVAPNNRGKSTLVNALQFLYVDEFRSMRFPKSPDETREHYFGKVPSYVLFECETAAGPQVLLVVGRGRVNSSSFARYVYAGEYQAEDFKDLQNHVVPFDVLKTRLADRSLAEVRPAEMWEVLGNPTRRGRAEENGHRLPHLGLLPVRTKEDYRSFREAYVRLLSLSDMSAAELRRLLIACHAAEVGDIKLDVAADYRDEFERAERTDNRLGFLAAVGSLVDQGERHRASVEDRRRTIESGDPSALAEVAMLLRALHASDAAGARAETELETRQVSLVEPRSTASRRAGGLQSDLKRSLHELQELDGLHTKWSACTPEMLQAMRDNADSARDQIAAQKERIKQAGTFDVNAMRRSVQSLRSESEGQERSLANWEGQLSGWLLAHGLKPDRIMEAFRVLNPALLRLIVGVDIEVANPSTLLARLQMLADRIEGGTYTDECVRVSLSAGNVPRAADLKDPEAARESLKLLKARLQDEMGRLAVAEDTGRAQAELAALVSEHERIRGRLAEYDSYLSRWQARPTREREVATLKTSIDEVDAELAEVKSKEQGIADERRRSAEDSKDRRATSARLQATVQQYRTAIDATQLPEIGPADYSDPVHEPSPTEVRSRATACITKLEGLVLCAREFKVAREELKAVQRQIAKMSQEHGQPQFFINDEEADWAELIDSRRAMSELQQAVRQSWDTLFTTIRARLDALMRGFRAIGNAATRVNAAMKRHRVSNLQEVQLDVVRQHEACDLLESLTEPEGLFSDRDALDRARDRMRRWIKDGKVIQLDDLFAVRIRVQSMDGHWSEAKSLDDIGSTGTGMTAKAMIFIQLVRAVVADERYRLHFYLDETGQLDDRNLAATTRMAVERGVVPITAEPRVRIEPLAHPTVTVYGLGQAADGQFFIDQRRTLRAARRQSNPEPAPDVADPA